MAKERWITVNGNHILIKDGQSVNEAIKERFGKKDGGEYFPSKHIYKGKHEISEDNGSSWLEVDPDTYRDYEADEDLFDDNNEDVGERFNLIHQDIVEEKGKFDMDEAKKRLLDEGFDEDEINEFIEDNYDPWEYEDIEIEDDDGEPDSLYEKEVKGQDTTIESDETKNAPTEYQKKFMNKIKNRVRNGESPDEIRDSIYNAEKRGSITREQASELDEFIEEYDPDEEFPEYKSKYKSEDYDDARFYPVSDEDKKAAGPKYLGRYHSIYDAAGLNDKDPGSWKKEKEMFKYVGDSNTGASIVQGPDGYFSGNPRINTMSFKTLEQAKDYLDKKNPEEHKYGVYFKPGDEREYIYRDAEDKYELEAPDAYRNARESAKKTEGLFNSYMDKVAKAPLKDLKYVESDLKYAGLTEEQNNKIREAVKQRQASESTGTETFNKLKEYVNGLSDDEKEMLRDLINYPRGK